MEDLIRLENHNKELSFILKAMRYFWEVLSKGTLSLDV
jgi:hypothetical protein